MMFKFSKNILDKTSKLFENKQQPVKIFGVDLLEDAHNALKNRKRLGAIIMQTLEEQTT